MKIFFVLFSGISILSLAACQGFVAGTAARTGVALAEERSIGGVVDDNTMYAEIQKLYFEHDSNDLTTDIDIRVHHGRVLLTGRTKKQETAIEAVRLAWRAHGVKEVINEITVSNEGDPMTFARDQLTETQVEARLLATKGIMSINYTVEVVNGMCYLLGVAQSEQELRNAATVASHIKGVRKVISYVRVAPPKPPVDAANPS